MTTHIIKRNNYVDGQFLDLDDFQTEQDYLIGRIQDSSALMGSGLANLGDVTVVPDTTMAEPISQASVAVAIPASPDINASNPQNFTVFPTNVTSTSFLLYTVFKTLTHNIQRVDLRVTLAQAATTEVLDLIVRVRQLIDPTNPLSPLANIAPIAQVQIEQSGIPANGSDEFLTLDFSNENSGQGVSVLSNSYYAIEIEYRRPLSSTSSLDVFHGPLNQNANLDSKLFTWVSSGGTFTQGFQNANGIFQQFQIYHRVYTSAVKLTAGEANIFGTRVLVNEDQFRFLEIPDRRNVDPNGNLVFNYVVLQYLETFTDPEVIPSTKNSVDTRITDSASVQVLSQPQWDNLVANSATTQFLLVAAVSDTNIVSILEDHTFTVPANSTNLAFHDWLNPSNTIPTTEATSLQQARTTDFIFFVSNVPAQVPLTDSFGSVQKYSTTVLDQNGNVIHRAGDPILDNIVRVVVNVTFDNGSNTRTLELAIVSEVGTNREFRNYAATISNLSDNPFDNVFSFNFNTDQLTPNVVYNFVAFTESGLPVFIQDYNKVLPTTTTGGQAQNVRNQSFTVFLDKNSITAVINQDLQLGAFNPASDVAQPGVVQYVPKLIQGETVTPIGAAQTESVSPVVFTLLPTASFTFHPVPMVRADHITKIITTDTEVQAAYNAGDIQVLVDNADGLGAIDITFSGKTDRDKGGNGTPILVSGTISPTVALSSTTTYQVKVRNDLNIYGARDNTNYSPAYTPYGPALVGGPSNIRTFSVIARGYSNSIAPLSNAGFHDGDQVFIYINDQPALDGSNNHISFTFNSHGPTTITIPTIAALGAQQYFREKQILSIQNSTAATPGTVLIDTGLGANEELKPLGQVVFNASEIPTAINPSAIITIKYNGITITQANIDYYKTQFSPIGTRDGFKITNNNIVSSVDQFISVPEAFALTANINQQGVDPSTFQSVAVFVDGINITSLVSPIGQKTIIADDGTPLSAGQVAFNPDQGLIKFFKQIDQQGHVITEAPSDFTRITVTYFKLDIKFVFNTTTNASYDPKYDLNSDGHIDETDLNIFNRAFGSSIGDVNYLAAADFNNDGVINELDLTAFTEHFGSVALGEADYSDATSARLGAILVVKQDDYLTSLKLVRAVSRAPDTTAPTGRTVLFLDRTTPVSKPGNYSIIFGFAAALSLGFIQVQVESDRPLVGQFNFNNILMFESGNPTNTRDIIQVEASQLANANNRYNSLLTFTPAVSATSTFTIQSLWHEGGIAVFNKADLVIPQKYELLDRTVYGPFKLQYAATDFATDGTSIAVTLKATDATMADGRPDPTGTHINGIPLSELTFTVNLTVPNSDGITKTIWSWYDIQPLGLDNKIVLSFRPELFIDHRIQGKDNVEVLTPFGVGTNQVALMPKYAGGDLQNDLSNLSVIRSDVKSKYVKPHTHLNDRDGGVLNSHSVQFADDLARISVTGDLTAIIYNLLDIIEQQAQQIELIRAVEGVVRWDTGLFWDDPNLFWDSN